MTEKQFNRKKLSRICSEEAYGFLIGWIKTQHPRNPYPLTPEQFFYSNVKNRAYLSKFLESVVIKLLRAKGADPQKAFDRGKFIGEKIGTDVLGHKKVIGQIWAKSINTRPGRADITCFYKGKMLNIEIKIGKDRQSDEQKREQIRAEKNGEKYIIVKTVDDFIKDVL